MITKETYTPDQEAFFAYVKTMVQDSIEFERLLRAILFRTQICLFGNQNYLKHRLKNKLIAGAKQYGSPIYDENRTTKEIQDECIDLIGWELIERFNKEYKKA